MRHPGAAVAGVTVKRHERDPGTLHGQMICRADSGDACTDDQNVEVLWSWQAGVGVGSGLTVRLRHSG